MYGPKSEGDKFAIEQAMRRQKLKKEREERRKAMMQEAPGYHRKSVAEASAPSPRKAKNAARPAGTVGATNAEDQPSFESVNLQPSRERGGQHISFPENDEDAPAKRSAAPAKRISLPTSGPAVSIPPAPPAFARAASIVAHDRISARVLEVQGEIEELEEVVEAMRASRASKRMSMVSDAGGTNRASTAARAKRRSMAGGEKRNSSARSSSEARRRSMVGGGEAPPSLDRQMESTGGGSGRMEIGMPTNVRKTAGVTFGSGGKIEMHGDDIPDDIRRALGIQNISEPRAAKASMLGPTVKIGADGNFEIGGEVTEEMRQILEELQLAKDKAAGKIGWRVVDKGAAKKMK